jgi:hypothetical protein
MIVIFEYYELDGLIEVLTTLNIVRLKVTIAPKFTNLLDNIVKGNFFSIFLGNLNTAYDYFSYRSSRLSEIQGTHPRKEGGDYI